MLILFACVRLNIPGTVSRKGIKEHYPDLGYLISAVLYQVPGPSIKHTPRWEQGAFKGPTPDLQG